MIWEKSSTWNLKEKTVNHRTCHDRSLPPSLLAAALDFPHLTRFGSTWRCKNASKQLEDQRMGKLCHSWHFCCLPFFWKIWKYKILCVCLWFLLFLGNVLWKPSFYSIVLGVEKKNMLEIPTYNCEVSILDISSIATKELQTFHGLRLAELTTSQSSSIGHEATLQHQGIVGHGTHPAKPK